MASERRGAGARARLGVGALYWVLGVPAMGAAACGGDTVRLVERDDDPSASAVPEGGVAPPGRREPNDTPPGVPPDLSPEAAGLFEGEGSFVALFPAARGAYVVHSDGIALVDATGTQLNAWQSPREITAAAFDGTTLGVADKSALHALDLDLVESTSVPLVETCASGVLLSSARFVCGPDNDWDRIFYVYDLAAGTQLSVSERYTYNGIPMRRVPGTDDFITITTTTFPSDFHLYRVSGANAVDYLGESPYHGDFAANEIFAFAGMPAHHLVTVEGLFLRLDASGSSPSLLMKDGTLGTLRGTERFVAFDQNAEGDEMQALVTTGSSWDEGATTYDVQRIDVPARLVVSRRTYTLSSSSILALRGDTDSVAAWVAVPRFIDQPQRQPRGFTIVRLPY